MKPARVLIVDDSAAMRGLIRALLSRDPAIEIAGEAGNAQEGRAAIKALNPDVVTLDVEMPGMNGLEFLEKIMRLRPMPVIMVSSLTEAGAAAAIRALETGAFDCIAKPGAGEQDAFAAALAAKIKEAASSSAKRLHRISSLSAALQARACAGLYSPDGSIVAIGASTGGVEAIAAILSEFPPNCPPPVITQHMPRGFTKSFSERLNLRCNLNVSEAADGAPLLPGHVYIAPGGEAHLSIAPGHPQRCRLIPGEPVNGHRPSVDVLFQSVANAALRNAVGVILTGMGRDGASGLLAMRRAGARTLGQDEASCLIYGMPKAAFESGAVERKVPLHRMAFEILRMTSAAEKEMSDALCISYARTHR